jgi:aryl-alcohol dehydrogenase-like predicted oxidoreductase
MIPRIKLGSTGRTTTQLGFGCTALMGAISERASLHLLAAAYDAGIRHFDVAPSYGYGAAEGCLGKFIAKRRDEVTVTTKYGIAPARRRLLVSVARRVVVPLMKTVPGLKGKLGQAGRGIQSNGPSHFTADLARQSLQHSLRELQTDRIDILLLHEATAKELSDDALLAFLQESVAQGMIGTFGFGGEADKVPALVAEKSVYCPVLQYQWSVYDSLPDYPASYRIHHRALSDNFPALHAELKGNPSLCRKWSDAVGQDLSSGPILSRLMLKTALVMNPASVILFSSRQPANIIANVQAAADPSLDESARRFYQVFRQDLTALTSANRA